MFTLTDDVLSQEILNAWERGVDVKVILDDEQCNVLGADAEMSCLILHVQFPKLVSIISPCITLYYMYDLDL